MQLINFFLIYPLFNKDPDPVRLVGSGSEKNRSDPQHFIKVKKSNKLTELLIRIRMNPYWNCSWILILIRTSIRNADPDPGYEI